MAKITNYTGGMRGLTLKSSKDKEAGVDTKWVAPGETVDYDTSLLVGPLPDFGKKADPDDADDGKDALIADLRQRVDELQATVDSQSAQINDLTAPAKK